MEVLVQDVSQLKDVYYSHKTKMLLCIYQAGYIIEYYNVPEYIYKKFITATCKNTFVYNNLKYFSNFSKINKMLSID